MNTEQTALYLRPYLADRNIRWFQPHELLYLGASHYKEKAVNQVCPIDYLENLANVAHLADLVRSKFAGPLHVVSAYRSRSYNAAIRGARRSMHLTAQALDLSPAAGIGISRLHHVASRMWDDGILPGGLGLYRWGIHIDTGRRRSW